MMMMMMIVVVVLQTTKSGRPSEGRRMSHEAEVTLLQAKEGRDKAARAEGPLQEAYINIEECVTVAIREVKNYFSLIPSGEKGGKIKSLRIKNKKKKIDVIV